MSSLSEINPFPSLFTIGPANKDHEAAIRCAITVFVPLTTLLLLDRVDLAIFASFGAFTQIYGRNMDHAHRFQCQLRSGVLMLLVLFLASLAGRSGITEQDSPWIFALCTAVVAAVSSAVTSFWQLRPAGSLFQTFAFAAVASVPVQPPLGEAMLTAVCTVVFALLLGISSRVHREHRTKLYWPENEELSSLRRKVIAGEALWYFIAAGAAGALVTALGPTLNMTHSYWAMIAAITPLVGHSTRFRISRGLQRVLGTFVGLALLSLVLLADPPVWLLILLIACFQFGAELFVARQYMLAQVFVVPLALLSTVLSVAAAAGEISTELRNVLLYDRALETVFGSAVGVACVVAPWAWRKFVRRREDPYVSG